MYRRLYSYLEELNILYPFQFGFREKMIDFPFCFFLLPSVFAIPLIMMNLAVEYLSI